MRRIDLILSLLVFGVLGLMAWYLVVLSSRGTECLANPINYGIKEYEDHLEVGASCTCSFSNPKYLPIIYTRNTSEPIVPPGQSSRGLPKFNYSGIQDIFVTE